MTASPQEVRKARAYLQGRNLGSKDVGPRMFANAAKELNVPYDELLRLIARLQMGGQGSDIITQEMLEEAVQHETS